MALDPKIKNFFQSFGTIILIGFLVLICVLASIYIVRKMMFSSTVYVPPVHNHDMFSINQMPFNGPTITRYFGPQTENETGTSSNNDSSFVDPINNIPGFINFQPQNETGTSSNNDSSFEDSQTGTSSNDESLFEDPRNNRDFGFVSRQSPRYDS